MLPAEFIGRAALLFAAAVFTVPSSAAAAPSPMELRAQAKSLHAPRIHPSGNAATAAYTIVDFGTPSAAAGPGTEPVAFNNTGQIVGYADVPVGLTTKDDCEVWTGTRFVNMSAAATYVDCGAVGIRDLSTTTKTYTITGTVNVPLKDTAIGFITTGTTATTAFNLSIFLTNSYSSIVAVNASGYGYGTSWYNPVGDFFSNQPPFVYSGGHLSPLQPTCTTARAGCLAFPFNEFSACPFGKCYMNEAGTVIGADAASGFLELDAKGTLTKLPLASTSPVTFVSMNELLQIAYYYTSANGEYAAVYDTTKKVSTHLGVLAGTGCTTYVPISMNNKTALLGYATGCTDGNERVWIWDSIHKMRDLSPLIPATSYAGISVFGINDNGQILADYSTSKGTVDWGYLEPVTP